MNLSHIAYIFILSLLLVLVPTFFRRKNGHTPISVGEIKDIRQPENHIGLFYMAIPLLFTLLFSVLVRGYEMNKITKGLIFILYMSFFLSCIKYFKGGIKQK